MKSSTDDGVDGRTTTGTDKYSANVRAIVTTAHSGDPAEALELADRFGLEAQPRAGRPLKDLPVPALVLAAKRADLYDGDRAWKASAGMAHLRVLRAERGEVDPLVAAAQLKAGDEVLDATLGIGGDALVAAHATQTKVVALEKNGLVAAFTQAGLRRLEKDGREPGQRIHIIHADHTDFLGRQPDRSFDVVLIDPMFRKAGDAVPLFEFLRTHAEHAPLTKETLGQARRVARRGVLVKDAAPGFELYRLGLTPVLSRRSAAIAFGWL